LTSTNFGSAWTGTAPNYWATTNTWQSFAQWRDSMIQPTVDENRMLNNPMMWERNTLHNYETGSVAYWDGSAVLYPYHQEIYDITFSIYGARGFVHPQTLIWLRRYRVEGVGPT